MRKTFPKKYVVINADDLGLCPSTNKAIFQAFSEGILTSASLLVTCPGYRDAIIRIKKQPRIGIGIHLSLTLGKAILPAKYIPGLAEPDGMFYDSFTRLLTKRSKLVVSQIKAEWTAQIEKALKSGVKLDHIDSQAHVHMIPHIFPIALHLGLTYKIPFIRLAEDRILHIGTPADDFFPIKNNNLTKLFLLNLLSTFDKKISRSMKGIILPRFYGVFHTGYMSEKVFARIFRTITNGVTEILTHPGQSVNDTTFDFKRQRMYDFMVSENRKKELKAVLDPSLKQHIKHHDIILTTYRKLASL